MTIRFATIVAVILCYAVAGAAAGSAAPAASKPLPGENMEGVVQLARPLGPAAQVGPPVTPQDADFTFPATPVGQTSSQCVAACFCTDVSACTCDASGTATLDHDLSAPFSAFGYQVEPYANGVVDCQNGTPVSLPVDLSAGQQLAFTLAFSPTAPGTFNDYLELSSLILTVSGSTPQCSSSLPVSGSTPQCSFSILSPTSGQDFLLSQANNTATMPVTFQAQGATGAVGWTATLQYQTSGGRPNPPFQLQRTFQTSANGQDNETYASQGGMVMVSAQDQSSGAQANPVSFVVTGTRVAAADVTSQLVSLYETAGGATPRLMTGIAQVESSYLQFKRRTLYNTAAFWPHESYDGGSHIGLMMLPTADELDYAWDWQTNTADGVSLFQGKLGTAQRKMKAIIAKHPRLRTLSATELEHMALVLYGPYASGDLGKQYYAAVKTAEGWTWIVNTSGNGSGVAYANSCVKAIHAQ